MELFITLLITIVLKEAGLAPGGWIRGLVIMFRKRRKNGCGAPSKWPLNRL